MDETRTKGKTERNGRSRPGRGGAITRTNHGNRGAGGRGAVDVVASL